MISCYIRSGAELVDFTIFYLVEFEGRRSLLDLAHLKNDLEDAMERRLDLLTCKSLHTLLKEIIMAEQA